MAEDFNSRIDAAAVEGLVTQSDTLSPLLTEMVDHARTEYAAAESEYAAAQEQLAQLLNPPQSGADG